MWLPKHFPSHLCSLNKTKQNKRQPFLKQILNDLNKRSRDTKRWGLTHLQNWFGGFNNFRAREERLLITSAARTSSKKWDNKHRLEHKQQKNQSDVSFWGQLIMSDLQSERCVPEENKQPVFAQRWEQLPHTCPRLAPSPLCASVALLLQQTGRWGACGVDFSTHLITTASLTYEIELNQTRVRL